MKKRALERLLWNALIVLFGLCSGGPAASGELTDRIVAVVNDDCITLSELNAALEPYLRKIQEEGHRPEADQEIRSNLRQKILNGMIDQKLTEQEAKRLQISADDKEVDEYIARIKSEHTLTEEELQKTLEVDGYTLQEYRERIKEQILQMKFINLQVKSRIAITEEDIRRYYEGHKQDYQGSKKYHLRSILVQVSPTADADEKQSALEKIQSIERAVATGGEGAFDELATRFSGDSSGVVSGDLGLFTLNELSEKIRETVRGMKEGELTPVLETVNGYQILMLQEIKEEPGRTLDETRLDIQEKLYRALVQEKYEAWLKKLRDRSYVKIIE